MKTIFAIIGFVVMAMWGFHFVNSKSVKPMIKTAWNIGSPYLNQAIDKAQESTKQAANR